jgi:Cu-Zn family superoxide dismutase
MNKALVPIIITAAGLAAHATPVDAGQPEHRRHQHYVEVSHGRFETLPGGADLGYDVRGGAIMFRADRHGGATVVVVRARGLDPATTYKTHVHNQPCSSTPAGGGHYQHQVGGPVDAVNEIWPTITTDALGRGVGFATHDERARDDAQSIVIHYSEDPTIRLACLDLS